MWSEYEHDLFLLRKFDDHLQGTRCHKPEDHSLDFYLRGSIVT